MKDKLGNELHMGDLVAYIALYKVITVVSYKRKVLYETDKTKL